MSEQLLWTMHMIFINLNQVRFRFFLIILDSEYPTVDGHLSINVYLNALENCYENFKSKCKNIHNGWEPKYQDFDYFAFHTPFCKMV